VASKSAATDVRRRRGTGWVAETLAGARGAEGRGCGRLLLLDERRRCWWV
jgi:hypothetical protein